MPSEADVKFEIGHVLFIDIVGYSKLLIDDQRELQQQLNQIVRDTEPFRVAEAAEKLVRLPTGDGMALVFFSGPEAPVQCALEISEALRGTSRLKLRMGINTGPVSGVADVNDKSNVAGAGINMAQRVMDCGDAGHILLSKRAAEDLAQYRQWEARLHDIGEFEVKHAVKVSIVNLYTGNLGNPQLPEKLKQFSRKQAATRRIRRTLIASLLLVAVALPVGTLLFFRRTPSKVPTSLAALIPEKSIAVLPFENLSEDKANAYFAEGIQDEILTRLAKIADLKVISHTSTQNYKSKPGNLPEIARQLAVANILEGSVQKASEQVHINVQLIRAATDEHLWAESYDRKFENIFGVEGEVATSVAGALQAKLSGVEQHALAQKPTNNPLAYDAYLRGLAFSLRPGYSQADNLNAIKHFGEAVKLDPKFALAWAWLGRENAVAYFNHVGDNVQALREAARDAADEAVKLQPDLGEAYLAQGYSRYHCERDYNSAIALFEKARQLLPNNSQASHALALVCRRLGEWQRSLDYFRQALEIDPRDAAVLADQADTLQFLRQYPAALKACDQVLDILPDNSDALAGKVSIYQAQGNLAAAAALLPPLYPHPGSYLFRVQMFQWNYERRYAEGIAALKTAIARPDLTGTPNGELDNITIKFYLAWFEQLAGETAAAQLTWQQVRKDSENFSRNKGDERATLELASASIALGDKAKAFTIVERAAALPPTGDAMWAGALLEVKAQIAVQAGEKDLAIQQLALCAQNPISDAVTYGDLKLNPLWDPLRGDPRFEKIVADLAPTNH
jgi:TolB-like protein/Flp pilus assembly protein TadD